MSIITPQRIDAPLLDIDKILFKETKGIPHERCRTERLVVANLIHHLDANGFKPYNVYDGEEDNPVSNMKEAMEIIFNVDYSGLHVRKEGGKRRWIGIVLGNGHECIHDHSDPDDKTDQFSAVMDAFDPDHYA